MFVHRRVAGVIQSSELIEMACICYGDLLHVFAGKSYLGFRERSKGRVSMQILALGNRGY